MTDGGEVAPMRDNVKSAGITICFFYLLVHSSLRFLLRCISWWKNRLKGSDREIFHFIARFAAGRTITPFSSNAV
jgi:hypothetical protein